MIKPVRHAEWALLDDNGAVEGLPNKAEADIQYKSYGQGEYQLLPRQYINDLFYLNDAWNKYFEAAIEGGASGGFAGGMVDVEEQSVVNITKDSAGKYFILTGSAIVVNNIIDEGGTSSQIGGVIKVRTTQNTVVFANEDTIIEGFSNTIPSGRVATFTLESLPDGTDSKWSCVISAGN